MGNSCVEYNGRYKFISDFELEIVANAMLYYLDEFVSLQESNFDLSDMQNEWNSILSEPINGAINLNLDIFFREHDQKQFLLDLISFSKVRFLANSVSISDKELSHIFPYKVTLEKGAIPSKLINEYFDALTKFICGDTA